MKLALCSFASGSSGNCFLVKTEQTAVLVDAGISGRQVERDLAALGLASADLSAVLITHEHSDHIKGLGVLARRKAIPIYGTKETLTQIKASKSLGEIPEELLRPILPDADFSIGDLKILPFSIDHDAANPVAYRVSEGRKSVAVATDETSTASLLGDETTRTSPCASPASSNPFFTRVPICLTALLRGAEGISSVPISNRKSLVAISAI